MTQQWKIQIETVHSMHLIDTLAHGVTCATQRMQLTHHQVTLALVSVCPGKVCKLARPPSTVTWDTSGYFPLNLFLSDASFH